MVYDKIKKQEIMDFFKSKKLLFAAWSCESKFYTGMAGWYFPLKKFFNDIIVFDPQKYLFLEGKEKMNRHFLEILKKEQPDYIFLYCDVDDGFLIDTLFSIREISPNSKIINFYGDDDTNFFTHSAYISLIADYNLVFQKDYIKEYKKIGAKNVFFTCATKLQDFKPMNLEKKYDVTFVGAPKSDRYELIKFLKDNGINICIFGPGWEKYPDFSGIHKGQPDNSEMVKIFNQSRINLCFSKNYIGNLHLKGRVFEVGACNSFALCEYYPTLKDIFMENKEIIMFRNKEDLLEKINHYIKNEQAREKIASSMHRKIIKKYNLDSELDNFFKIIYRDRNIISKKVFKTDKKIIVLSEEDFEKGESFINEKIKGSDFISFKKGECISSKYKNYLQASSLAMFKKPASFCDYYCYSPRIGIYAGSFSYDFFSIPEEDFFALLDLNAVMVAKEFFLKNIREFFEVFKGKKINFINASNTSFVSIHLTSINGLKINSKLIGKVFHSEIDAFFSSLIHQKKLFSSSYLYKFLIECLFFGKFFLLKDLVKRRFYSNKMKTINRIIEFKKNSLYLNRDVLQ
jgi:spore maturation protein CgeB